MYVNEYKKKRRLETCMVCPHYRKSFKILGITIFKKKPQCNICKCSLDLKIIWTDAKCPKNKW